MHQPYKPRLEAAVDLLLLGIGVAIACVSWGYGFGTIAQPGPGLYPFFVGGAIAVFAAILFASQLRAPAAADGTLEKSQRRTLYLMGLTFCAWIVTMPLLGYVLVTGLATLALCKTMKLEGWRKPLAVAVGVSLFIYVIFDKWLYIDLPRGLLFGFE